MITINLLEMLAAADPALEDDAERIAFNDIPGPPIPGLKPPETDLASEQSTSPDAAGARRKGTEAGSPKRGD